MNQYPMEPLLAQLHKLADEPYRIFNESLIPGAEGSSIGIRMPTLRKIARQILAADPIGFLDASLHSRIHELKLLHAVVLSRAKLNREERFRRLRDFVPTLDNWAVCDLLCGDWKPSQSERDDLFPFLSLCMQSPDEFVVRFGAVMLILYYRDEIHLESVFLQYAAFRHEGYYAKMAVAWGLSYLYVDAPERTVRFLQASELDRFTHNKAIQKILESHRVSAQEKQYLRTLRR